MRNPFRSKYKVTQNFGVNPDYYKQFGLKGHEGIDLIPTGTVWDVLCLADGIVVKDDDIAGEPKADAYGIFVTVWHPTLLRATQYCHFKENYVSNGQQVKAGDKLGLMGSSGNTQGAHLHLNLFATDENGIRLNKDNGYIGGIDPSPFLEDGAPISADPNQLLKDRADAFVAVSEKLNVPPEKDIVLAECEKFLILEDALRRKEQDLQAKDRQLKEISTKAEGLEIEVKKMSDENLVLKKTTSDMQVALEEEQRKIITLTKDINDLKEQSQTQLSTMSAFQIIQYGFQMLFRGR